jgi:1,4-dihydroxy-2-naphthoyl-CoA hydrolase
MSEIIDLAPAMQGRHGGWVTAMGLTITKATPDEVVAHWTVADIHCQAYGIVHGGVHAGVIETVCSVGAAVFSLAEGRNIVGLENSTTFLRAVRVGAELTVRATPLIRGRRSQVWEATIRGMDEKPVASGRVRLLCLEPETELAGSTVTAPGPLGDLGARSPKKDPLTRSGRSSSRHRSRNISRSATRPCSPRRCRRPSSRIARRACKCPPRRRGHRGS